MATKSYPGGVMVLTAPTVVLLGNADPQNVGTWLIELDTTGATYSMTPRGRQTASGVAPDTTSPALPYTDQTDATGAVVAGSTPIAGTTATAVRLVKVVADGLTIALDFATLSAGSVRLSASPLRG